MDESGLVVLHRSSPFPRSASYLTIRASSSLVSARRFPHASPRSGDDSGLFLARQWICPPGVSHNGKRGSRKWREPRLAPGAGPRRLPIADSPSDSRGVVSRRWVRADASDRFGTRQLHETPFIPSERSRVPPPVRQPRFRSPSAAGHLPCPASRRVRPASTFLLVDARCSGLRLKSTRVTARRRLPALPIPPVSFCFGDLESFRVPRHAVVNSVHVVGPARTDALILTVGTTVSFGWNALSQVAVIAAPLVIRPRAAGGSSRAGR